MRGKKTDGLLENLYKIVLKTLERFHVAPQLYGLPYGILRVFYHYIYENKFQNSQIFQQTISLFPEQSTLAADPCVVFIPELGRPFCQ
jgi:hypothetical protein